MPRLQALFLRSVLLAGAMVSSLSPTLMAGANELEPSQHSSAGKSLSQAAPTNSTPQAATRRVRPTFFEEPRRVRQSGFEETFLVDALNGSSDPFGSGAGTTSRAGVQKGEAGPSLINGPTYEGTFTRTDDNTVTFVSNDESVSITGSFTTSPVTVEVDGNSVTPVSAGFVGNDAFATTIEADGQATSARVFNVGRQEPPIGSSFSGTVTTGVAPDR